LYDSIHQFVRRSDISKCSVEEERPEVDGPLLTCEPHKALSQVVDVLELEISPDLETINHF
jgi:hypothetical protein